MQDSVTTQLVVAVNVTKTMPFCIFFLNSKLKENKKNLEKKEKEKREKTLRGMTMPD